MVNDQVQRVFVVNSIAPVGIRAYQLKPGQIGLFDEKTQVTVSSPKDCNNRPVTLKWKSTATGNKGSFPDMLNFKLPISTQPITNIDATHLFDSATAERKVFEAYLGYDGINECKNLVFNCGSTYQINMLLQGKPVRDTFGRNPMFTATFTTDCCEDCTVDESIKKALKKAVKAIEEDGDMKRLYPFFEVHPIVSCCSTPIPFPRVDFQDYCISICDSGDANALANVQGSYQNLDIVRSSRVDSTSTYTVECVASLPAAYVQSGTVLPNCSVCPAGFTSVAASKKYIVTIDNSGVGTTPANWLTEVQAAGAFSVATKATRLSRNGSVSVYEVLVPVSFVEPVTPIAETSFSFVSNVDVSCVQTTPSTIVWVQCGEKYKITRTLCLTLKNGDCGSPAADLAEMQAYYAGFADIVPGSIVQTNAGDCLSTYTIDQYSNCLEDGCDTVGADKAKFGVVSPYKNMGWATCECEGWTVDVDGCPVPPPVTVENCRGGLKFVGKNVENEIIPCDYDIFEAEETEGITMQVSIGEIGADKCDWKLAPWSVVQLPTTPQGLGTKLLRDEVQSRQYELYGYTSPMDGGNRWSHVLGRNFSADPTKLYNTVTVYHNSDRVRRHQKTDHALREMIVLAVDHTKTKLLNDIKTMVNGIVAAQGGCEFV